MSIFTDFKRIVYRGLVNFKRTAVVSSASVLVMTIVLFVIGSLILANASLSFILSNLEEKVDINVYFYPGAQEENILSLKSALERMAEVESVGYISRERALEIFVERHQDDELILQSLEELNTNPLGASLVVQAQSPEYYPQIVEFLESEKAAQAAGAPGIVEDINYDDNSAIIDNLTKLLAGVRKFGVIVTLLLIAISIVIAFNTLSLGIFVSREEISIMRLVGAENRYIRGPFLVEGVLYGLFATIIVFIVLYFILQSFGEKLEQFFSGFDIFKYFIDNFVQLAVVLLAIGVILGVISSLFATQKYLKK